MPCHGPILLLSVVTLISLSVGLSFTIWPVRQLAGSARCHPVVMSAVNSRDLKEGAGKDKNSSSSSSSSSKTGSFFRSIFSSKNSTIADVDSGNDNDNDTPKSKQRKPIKDPSDSSNFISAFLRRRRAAKQRDKERELLLTLARESPSVDSEYLLSQALNTTNLITSVFDRADRDVSRVRRELNNVTPRTKAQQDEIQLDRLRQKVEAQRVADQRTRDRFEQQQRVKAETQAKAKIRREERKAANRQRQSSASATNDGNNEEKPRRGSVLSAAQKFVLKTWQQTNEEWIVVCPKTRISPGEILPVTAAGLDLLLVASKDGSSLHCIANSCPHLGTPLEVGTLERRPIETPSTTTPFADDVATSKDDMIQIQETDIANMLTSDGCEDCIVCPLHKTAFALESGEVRGEWCPYPPVLGKITGAVKPEATLAVFDVRARGKNIEVRINSPVATDDKRKE